MKATGFLLVAALLVATALSHEAAHDFMGKDDTRFPGPGGGFGMPEGGFGFPGFPEGGGGGIPGFPGGGGGGIPGYPGGGGKGWGNVGGGWGAGYGGPGGGYSRGGVVRPSVVCKDRGPCYNKRVTCPARCFSSYSSHGKNYGYGGGGGGCTIDCRNKCVGYC